MRIAVINDTSVTRHFGCTAVMQAILDEIRDRGHEVAFRWPVGQDWQPAAAKGLFDTVDLVLVNGEGTIHNSATRPRAAQLGRIGPYAANVLKKPAHLINATIAALDSTTADDLRHFSLIHVRETASRDYLAGLGLTAGVVPDLSLSHVAPEAGKRAAPLVTDSVIKPLSAILQQAAQQVDGRYLLFKRRKTWREKLDLLGNAKKANFHDKVDERLAGELHQTLRDIAGAKVLLTGRFHAFCMAVLCRTPVIALESNTHKIGAMARDIFGTSDRVLQGDTASPDLLAARIVMADYTAAEQDAIALYLNKAAQARHKMWSEIL